METELKGRKITTLNEKRLISCTQKFLKLMDQGRVNFIKACNFFKNPHFLVWAVIVITRTGLQKN
jgi:hypothetical protein